MRSTPAPEPPVPEPESAPALEIAGYGLDYATRRGPVPALVGIDLAIARGEVLGLVGESGSGKTSLAWAIMRALPPNARETGGSIRLAGEELIGLTGAALRGVRGKRIGMVFQDPSTSLNPTLTLGEQLAETLMLHRRLARDAAWREGEAAMARVGLRDPAAMMRRYPHAASGGEKQRVVIATAFACRPELVIFDEPTTALDVITARQILDLFAALQRETGTASLYISHDLALVSRVAARVAIIHRGAIVESGPIGTVFARPRHAYTQALLAAVPRPEARLVEERAPAAAPLLEMERVSVRYERPSLLDDLMRRTRRATFGSRDVSLALRPAEILGVVGESGSGKSSLARALTGLAAFAGEIRFDGRRIADARAMDRAYRRDVQIVFQHPDSSLNPRHRVREILARPLRLYAGRTGGLAGEIARLLEEVRLPAAFADRYPHQLSGGEKQRVAIARAFASRPRLVICDEVTSSLDVSVQAAVVRLLVELHTRSGASALFISHDINLVRQLAHRIAVMFRGELVETIAVDELAARGPRHPYTAALIDAVPSIRLEGDPT